MPTIPNNGDIQIDFKAELEEAKKQAQGVGRYKRLEAGKIYDLSFSGKATLQNNKWGKEQYLFELTEKTDKGENMMFGVTKKSPFAQKIIEQLFEGNFNLKVLRTGEGQQDTRYTLISK